MLSQDQLLSTFSYCDETGVLTWKTSPRNGIREGDVAGTVAEGYIIVGIEKRVYPAHRVIFLMKKGYLPDFIDHKDGNTINNAWDNLRECTRQENARNAGKNKETLTNVRGVNFCKRTNRFIARCTVDGVTIHLGRFKSLEDAKVIRESYAKEMFGEFYRENE